MKYNKKATDYTKTVNHEGAEAYKLTSEMDLYSAVVTSSLSNKFYEGEQDRVERVRFLVSKADPMFVAQLAVYTREQMYMRTMPLVLAVELAKRGQCGNIIRKTAARVIQRADEIPEILAYYALANGRCDGRELKPDGSHDKVLGKLSYQLKMGIGDALNKFNEYAFAKYNRKGEVTLKDALFLCHPKPKNEEQQVIFNKIVEGTLDIPYTWETSLSALGQGKYATGDEKLMAFRDKWEELIASKKLGYMALLRNLRNILESGVSKESLVAVCETLSSKEQVLKSKQFPFRFLSAYRQIKEIGSGKVSMVLNALEQAMVASAENIKGFGYDTAVVIACDTSGSMQTPISERSVVQQYDIGLVLGMLLHNRCKDVVSGIFGDSWKIINLPQNNILSNADELHRRCGEVGYSTNGYKAIKDLRERKYVANKIMMFTDCQLWDSDGYSNDHTIQKEWKQYKKDVAPNAKLYVFDLAGYGNTPVSLRDGGVYLIAGWSDRIFDILESLEDGKGAIEKIKEIKI